MVIIAIIVSIFNGWGIGANDAANSFADWIGARVGKVKTGMLLCGSFALAGAMAEGWKVTKTLGTGIVPPEYLVIKVATLGLISIGVWLLLSSYFGMPVSTTHSAVGAVMGAGLALGAPIKWNAMQKIVICWLTTPTGACLIAFLLFSLVWFILTKFHLERKFNRISKILLTCSSCYVAYTWGANDVANATALLTAGGIMSVRAACALGGLSIFIGAITFGGRVAESVGFKITRITSVMGICADLATGMIIHFFTQLGIPVSTTHALVGAIAGVGMARGVKSINIKMLRGIVFAWVITPLVTGLVSYGLISIF